MPLMTPAHQRFRERLGRGDPEPPAESPIERLRRRTNQLRRERGEPVPAPSLPKADPVEEFLSQENRRRGLRPLDRLTREDLPDRGGVTGGIREGFVATSDALFNQLPGDIARIIQTGIGASGDEGRLQDFIEHQEAESARNLPSIQVLEGDKVSRAIAGAPRSAVTSVAAGAAGALLGRAGGAAAGSVVGPGGTAVGAVGGAGLVSGGAFYAMARNQFFQELRKQVESDGVQLTQEQWDDLKRKHADRANEFGMFEAGPEAISNMVFSGAFLKSLFKAGSFLGKGAKATQSALEGAAEEAAKNALKNMTGKSFRITEGAGKAGKVAAGAAKMAATVPTELITEAATYAGQENVRYQMGWREDAPTLEEFWEEAGPEVIGGALLMGGGYSALNRIMNREDGAELTDDEKATIKGLRFSEKAVKEIEEAKTQREVARALDREMSRMEADAWYDAVPQKLESPGKYRAWKHGGIWWVQRGDENPWAAPDSTAEMLKGGEAGKLTFGSDVRHLRRGSGKPRARYWIAGGELWIQNIAAKDQTGKEGNPHKATQREKDIIIPRMRQDRERQSRLRLPAPEEKPKAAQPKPEFPPFAPTPSMRKSEAAARAPLGDAAFSPNERIPTSAERDEINRIKAVDGTTWEILYSKFDRNPVRTLEAYQGDQVADLQEAAENEMAAQREENRAKAAGAFDQAAGEAAALWQPTDEEKGLNFRQRKQAKKRARLKRVRALRKAQKQRGLEVEKDAEGRTEGVSVQPGRDQGGREGTPTPTTGTKPEGQAKTATGTAAVGKSVRAGVMSGERKQREQLKQDVLKDKEKTDAKDKKPEASGTAPVKGESAKPAPKGKAKTGTAQREGEGEKKPEAPKKPIATPELPDGVSLVDLDDASKVEVVVDGKSIGRIIRSPQGGWTHVRRAAAGGEPFLTKQETAIDLMKEKPKPRPTEAQVAAEKKTRKEALGELTKAGAKAKSGLSSGLSKATKKLAPKKAPKKAETPLEKLQERYQKSLSKRQAQFLTSLARRLAKYSGVDADVFAEEHLKPDPTFKGRAPNLSDFVYEFARAMRPSLKADDKKAVENWAFRKRFDPKDEAAAVKWEESEKKWTKKEDDKFAHAFVRYLRDGKPKNKAVAKLMDLLNKWMREMFPSTRGTPLHGQAPAAVQEVFERMVAGNIPKGTAPKRQKDPTRTQFNNMNNQSPGGRMRKWMNEHRGRLDDQLWSELNDDDAFEGRETLAGQFRPNDISKARNRVFSADNLGEWMADAGIVPGHWKVDDYGRPKDITQVISWIKEHIWTPISTGRYERSADLIAEQRRDEHEDREAALRVLDDVIENQTEMSVAEFSDVMKDIKAGGGELFSDKATINVADLNPGDELQIETVAYRVDINEDGNKELTPLRINGDQNDFRKVYLTIGSKEDIDVDVIRRKKKSEPTVFDERQEDLPAKRAEVDEQSLDIGPLEARVEEPKLKGRIGGKVSGEDFFATEDDKKPPKKPPPSGNQGDFFSSEKGFIAIPGEFVEKMVERVSKIKEVIPPKIRLALRRAVREDFAQTPEIRRLIDDWQEQVRRGAQKSAALIKQVVDNTNDDTEMLIANRILAGHPADLNNLSPAVLNQLGKTKDEVRELAQQMTQRMQAVGLPVREEWLDGDKHWFPILYQKHKIRNLAGKLTYAVAPKGMKFRREELSHQMARRSDRFVVTLKRSGRPAKNDRWSQTLKRVVPGQAIFKTRAEAERFVREQAGGYIVKYTARADDGKIRQVTEIFETQKEQRAFVNSVRDDAAVRIDEEIKVREMKHNDKYKILEPRSFRDLQAAGLVENVVDNLNEFSKAQAMIAKTEFFDKLAKSLMDKDTGWFKKGDDYDADVDANKYVAVKDLELKIPKDIENVAIQDFLDGYVEKGLGDDLAGAFGQRKGLMGVAWMASDFLKALDRVPGYRRWVTYRNPFRLVKQVGENNVILYFANTKAFLDVKGRLTANKIFWSELEVEKNVKNKLLKEFIEFGFLESDFLHGPEIEEMARNAKAAESVGDMNDAIFKAINVLMNKSIGKAVPSSVDVAEKIDAKLHRLYNLQDSVYKFQLYSWYRNHGKSADEAQNLTERYMFMWDRAPKLVKFFQFIPFGPSVLWQFSRIFTHKIKDTNGGALLKLGLTIAALAVLRDELDDEMGITPQMRKGQIPMYKWHDFALPISDTKGRTLKLDAYWLVPFGGIGTYIPRDWKGVREASKSVQPMAMQPVLTLMTQTDRFGNPIIWPNTKDPKKKREQTMRLIAKMVEDSTPGLLGQYWATQYRNSQRTPSRREDIFVKGVGTPAIGIKTPINYNRSSKRSSGGRSSRGGRNTRRDTRRR